MPPLLERENLYVVTSLCPSCIYHALSLILSMGDVGGCSLMQTLSVCVWFLGVGLEVVGGKVGICGVGCLKGGLGGGLGGRCGLLLM